MKRTLMIAVAALALTFAAGSVLAQSQPAGDLKPAQPKMVANNGNAAPTNAAAPANTATPTTQGAEGKPPESPLNSTFLIVIAAAFILMMFWSSRSKRKQEQKRKEMLNNLKKGDRVTSIGGIIGSVIEVRDDEVTVKVDETNNVRMKFARWAIRGVGEAAKQEGPEDKK